MKGKKRISVVDFLLRAVNISFTMTAHYALFIANFKMYQTPDADGRTVVILEHAKSRKVMAVDKENDTVTLEVRD